MAYIYESIQSGVFNFTIPGEDKTVTLFHGSRVTVKQKLAGGYLRVLKLVEETTEETQIVEKSKKEDTAPKAKVADKITQVVEVEETPLQSESVTVTTEDTLSNVKEVEEPIVASTPTIQTPKNNTKGKKRSK